MSVKSFSLFNPPSFYTCLRLDLGYFRAMRTQIFIALFLCLATAVCGQRYSFVHRGAEGGLVNAVVNDLAEDETGMLWLATDGGGLVRFDGNDFQMFPVFNQLPSSFVTVLEKDQSGNFWIGTERGLAHYDGKNLTVFTELKLSKINAIAIAENNVFVAAREGLFSLTKKTFQQSVIVENTEVFAAEIVAGKLYYSTPKGVFLKSEKSVEKVAEFPANRIISLKNGVVFCRAENAFVQQADTSFVLQIPSIRDACVEENGTLWLASQRSGLIRVHQKKTEIIDAANGLTFSRLRCLLVSNGKLWVGSQQGLSFLQNPAYFALDASQGLPDESVHVGIKLGGDFWLGTASGVSVFSENGAVRNYGAANGLPGGIVLDLAIFENKIWAATEQGIAFFEGNKFHPINAQNGFSSDFVFCLEPSVKHLYLGTANGAFVYENGHVTPLRFTDSIPDGIVDIQSSEDGFYFVGISGAMYRQTGGELAVVQNWHGMRIDSTSIYTTKYNPGLGALLVNGEGVYLWNGTQVILVNQQKGLASINFKSAAFVGNRLWLTTDAGMQFIEVLPTGQRNVLVRTVNEFLSINSRDFNQRSMRVSGSGELLNGSNNGLLVLANESVKANPNAAVSIQEVKLFFKEETAWGEYAKSLSHWRNLPENLSLPHDKNYLSFNFNVPTNFVYDSKVFMRYKLVGQDENWTAANGRREAFFTNISPGKYSFEVESSLQADFSEAKKANFNFKITAPFWMKWWFWVLVVVGFVALVLLLVRYRINQLNQKLVLETALADSERKALRLQMNPHFVFNALDAISGFIYKNEPKEAVQYLGNFAKLMRLTLESSRETLVPLQNELQLLKNYMALEQLRFSNKFDFDIDLDEEIDPFDAHLPPMLLQPFVENAIIHGLKHKKDGQGMLLLKFVEKDDHLVCTITDNGVGRKRSGELNANRNKKSLATSITQERIDLLAKSLGERVRFVITDLRTEDGTASGTKVEITFPHLYANE